MLGVLSMLYLAQIAADTCSDGGTCDDGPGLDFIHMWTTPFMAVRPKFVNKDMFNQRLSGEAMKAFTRFKESLSAQPVAETNRFVILSEKFFQWQRDNFNRMEAGSTVDESFQELYSNEDYVTLRKLVVKYSSKYLQRLQREETVDHIFCWVGLTYEGMYHLSHTHPDSMLSAVYYSRTPPGSGPIVFDDPRGPRFPFDGRHIHEVRAGELLVFPSWLVHEVIPTQGDVPRVSFACNMRGVWETTTDISFGIE